VIEILKGRRSIRKYLDMEIESEKIDLLKKAILLAPSSKSNKPLEFIFVDEKKKILELSNSKKFGSAFLKTAPLAVVIVGDENKSDVWIEDASIAAIILQLTGESIGLKSCWIQIRNRIQNDEVTSEEHVRKTLNIPDNLRILSIIAMGYPDEIKEPYKEETLNYSIIKKNNYSCCFKIYLVDIMVCSVFYHPGCIKSIKKSR
jgi:nitroreductase